MARNDLASLGLLRFSLNVVLQNTWGEGVKSIDNPYLRDKPTCIPQRRAWGVGKDARFRCCTGHLQRRSLAEHGKLGTCSDMTCAAPAEVEVEKGTMMQISRSRAHLSPRWTIGGVAFIGVMLMAGRVPASPPDDPGFSGGVVAADHVLASAAGLQMLRQGGNAVDAACAAAFALGVVNPAGSGIGGGGFMLFRGASGPRVSVLDFRETAPAAASREMYLAPGVPADASRRGGLAVGTPGEVLGCAEALRRHGRLKLALVLAPAIAYAERGFPAGEHLMNTIIRLRKELRAVPGLARVFLPGGRPPEVGQLLYRPAAGAHPEDIARGGPRVFYRGEIARAIVSAVQGAGGILTRKDLVDLPHQEAEGPQRPPIAGYDIYTMPPALLGGRGAGRDAEHPRSPGRQARDDAPGGGAGTLDHRGHEARLRRPRPLPWRHGLRQGAAPAADLPGPRREPLQVVSARAPCGPSSTAPRILARAPSGGSGGTSHISVVDRWGGAVALTTTINTSFGALLVAGRHGDHPQQRDGRLRRAARRAQRLRSDPG